MSATHLDTSSPPEENELASDAADLGGRLFSYYPSIMEPASKAVMTLAEVAEFIRNPTIGIIATIKEARAALTAGDEDLYDEKKRTLPAFTPGGTFSERKASGLKCHSGLMSIDLDDLTGDALASAIESLKADPHTALLHVTASGNGLRVLFPLDEKPGGKEAHETAFTAAANYLKSQYGLTADPACKDLPRASFLSYDPKRHYNPAALPLVVDEWRDLTKEEKEVERLQQILTDGHISSITVAPPHCPLILVGPGGRTIGEAGNIVTLEGLVKSGKTAALSAILGAMIAPENCAGDFFGFEAPIKEGLVLHFDSEQSPKGCFRLLETAVKRRAGLVDIPPRLRFFSLLQAPVEDRWPACQLAAERLAEEGPLAMVCFDGGADFLLELNDEAAARKLVAQQHAFAVRYGCVVLIVIHENPNGEGGKTRGHYGSELWRKAQSCIGITKGEDGISAMHGKFLRDGDWPKREATYFKYDADAGMHVTAGDPTEERRSARTAAKTEAKAEELHALARKILSEPVMTHTALVNAIMRQPGRVSDRTARNRIQQMVELGILNKRGDGHYEAAK